MDICAGIGKRRKSVGKNTGPIFNLFSPQHDLLDGYRHVESLFLVSKIRSRFLWLGCISDCRGVEPIPQN